MSDRPKCGVCGEPMPEGEEMFKYHGFSGDCPKPPLPQPKTMCVIEYLHRQAADGTFWLDVVIDRNQVRSEGPFLSEGERQRAHDDLLSMMRSVGAIDVKEQ